MAITRRALLGVAAATPLAVVGDNPPSPRRAMGPLPSGRPLRILCIGDSITLGWGDPTGLGYRRELGRLLAAAGVAHEFVVRAIAGTTTRDWLQWAGYEVGQIQPDLVLLLLGTNDSNPKTGTLAAFETNYGALLNQIVAAKADVSVCAAWIQHVAASWDGNTQIVCDAITRQVWPTPLGWNGPMRPGVVGIASIRSLPTAYLYDGIHPSGDGYDGMGWQWFRAVTGWLGLPRC